MRTKRLYVTMLAVIILLVVTQAQSPFTTEPERLKTPEEALALSRMVKNFLKERYGLTPTENNTKWVDVYEKELFVFITAVPAFTLYRHFGLAELLDFRCVHGVSLESCKQRGQEDAEELQKLGLVTYFRVEPQAAASDIQLSQYDIDRDLYELINRFLMHEDLHFHLDMESGVEESFAMFLSALFTYEFCSEKRWPRCTKAALDGLDKLLEKAIYHRALYAAIRSYWNLTTSSEEKRLIWPNFNEAQHTEWSSYIFYVPSLFRLWRENGGDIKRTFSAIKQMDGLSEEEIARRLGVELQ